MLYLNTRHTLPQIGLRTELATLSTPITQPKSHGDYRPARSGLGYSQVKIDVDTYPSRHAYGFSTMRDFTKQYGDQGKADIQETTSSYAQSAWAMIDNAAKKGHDEIAAQAHQKLSAEVSKQRYIVAAAIPDPIVTVHPSELHGEPDLGHQAISIEASAKAEATYHPGKFEVYLKQKGSIHRWVTEGRYDTYA